MSINIINKPLPLNKYNLKATWGMTPIGITIHETDNNAAAKNEISYMQSNDYATSFHFAVDENEIIQGVPLNKNTWHAGDGAGNGNMRTISIEICRNYRTDDLTNYYKARANAEKLVGYLLNKYNWNESNIYTHNDWSGKNCPRVILKEGYLSTFKRNAMSYKNGQPVNSSKPSSPKPSVPSQSKKTVAELAQEVLAGKWGNGDERKRRLEAAGYNYQAIQDEVNKRAGAPSQPSKPVLKSIAEIAKEVLAGKWGNGDERKQKLEAAGYNFQAIQAEVNKLAGQPSEPKLKSVAEIAKEVNAGKWGNGDERKQRLQAAGYNYDAVQKEVNRLAGATKSNNKSNETIAKEVLAGKWGNGAERKIRLEAAGYNFNTIQTIVNRLV